MTWSRIESMSLVSHPYHYTRVFSVVVLIHLIQWKFLHLENCRFKKYCILQLRLFGMSHPLWDSEQAKLYSSSSYQLIFLSSNTWAHRARKTLHCTDIKVVTNVEDGINTLSSSFKFAVLKDSHIALIVLSFMVSPALEQYLKCNNDLKKILTLFWKKTRFISSSFI